MGVLNNYLTAIHSCRRMILRKYTEGKIIEEIKKKLQIISRKG
jgi:hypothetical protein